MLREDGSENPVRATPTRVVHLEADEPALGAIADLSSSDTEDGLAAKVDLAFLGKVGVAATGFSYVIGVFSTNAYLQEYKVADFDLLRPRLVFSGALALSFLATSKSVRPDTGTTLPGPSCHSGPGDYSFPRTSPSQRSVPRSAGW